MTAKIKKGDKVFIIAGKDKGKEGEVLKILGKNKAIVQGINLVKKHSKPTPNAYAFCSNLRSLYRVRRSSAAALSICALSI